MLWYDLRTDDGKMVAETFSTDVMFRYVLGMLYWCLVAACGHSVMLHSCEDIFWPVLFCNKTSQ